MDQSQSS